MLNDLTVIHQTRVERVSIPPERTGSFCSEDLTAK